MSAPAGYKTVETDERVPDIDVELVTRFHWRAERRCRCMNGRRFVVVAMQNQAVAL